MVNGGGEVNDGGQSMPDPSHMTTKEQENNEFFVGEQRRTEAHQRIGVEKTDRRQPHLPHPTLTFL